jgi:predicted acylesterase/phospholipase RssA
VKVDDHARARLSPTNDTAESRQREVGTGICLSGGGYRAMLFHVGVLWRLYEAGRLKLLKRISSVSGGSISSAVLALAWPRLSFDPAKLEADFVPQFVEPLRKLAGHTLDANAVLGGIFLPGTIANHLAGSNAQHQNLGHPLRSPRFFPYRGRPSHPPPLPGSLVRAQAGVSISRSSQNREPSQPAGISPYRPVNPRGRGACV